MSQERGESVLQPGGRFGPWSEQPARPSGPPAAGAPSADPAGAGSAAGHQSSAHQSSAHQSSAHQSSAHQPSAHQPSAHQPSAHQPSAHQPSAHQPSAGSVPAAAASGSPWDRPAQHPDAASPWDRPQAPGRAETDRDTTPTAVFPAPPGVAPLAPRSVQATSAPTQSYGSAPASYGSSSAPYGGSSFGQGSSSYGAATPGYGAPQQHRAPGEFPSQAPPSQLPPGQVPPGGFAPVPQPARAPRRGPGLIATTVVAAVTALLVGGAAGLGGAAIGSGALDPTRTATGVPTPGTPTGGGTGVATPSSGPTGPLSGSAAVAAKMLPSTVTILVSGPRGRGSGSGFVLDAEGRIMTNNHVVDVAADGGTLTVVFNDTSRATARIVGRSASYDLAVIEVDPDGLSLVPSELGDSDTVAIGDETVALGAPRGLGGTVTSGILSARDRPVAVGRSAADASFLNALQTDAAINPGNSGGPLADSQGRVIGVNSAILSNATDASTAGNIGIGFAIPINQASVIAEQLVEQGYATFPTIGAMTETAGNNEGARIEQIESGSPAADAGLEPGDLVVGVNDRPVGSMVEFIVAVRTYRPGDDVRVVYTRNGAEQQATVTLGEQRG